LRDLVGVFEQPVGQRRLAVVDVGNDAEIPGKFGGKHRQAAVTSVNSLKLFTVHVFSVRRANPLSTPPGPSSQNSVVPAAAALRMSSSQRTDDTTCLTSAALMAAGSLIAWPVVL